MLGRRAVRPTAAQSTNAAKASPMSNRTQPSPTVAPSSETPSSALVPMDQRWRGILRGESPLALTQRFGRRAYSLVPASVRCKFCNAPFRGSYAGIFGRLGYTPSRKNPNICERCIERAPAGGALVPVSVLFADVRGYTSIAERLSSFETTILLNLQGKQQFKRVAKATYALAE